MIHVLFVASSPFHLEMLDAMQGEHPDVRFDAIADSRLQAAGALPVDTEGFSLDGRRRLLAQADRRRRARALVADHDVVVIGNDMAPLERALVAASRELGGRRTVLLQDGLFPAWESGLRMWVARVAVAAGWPHLAPTVYGAGGADVVGALGPAWVPALRRRGARDVRVVGNAAMARDVSKVLALRRGRAPGDVVTFFTSNLLHGLGRRSPDAHQAQLREVAAVARELRGHWSLRIRPHPAEDPDAYSGIAELVQRGVTLAEALAATDRVLVTTSAVAIVAARAGIPVARPALDRPLDRDLLASRWLGTPIIGHDLDAALRRATPSDGRRARRLLELSEQPALTALGIV